MKLHMVKSVWQRWIEPLVLLLLGKGHEAPYDRTQAFWLNWEEEQRRHERDRNW